jgi:hypothetical protein
MILAFIILGGVLPRLGWWMGRSDITRIEEAIRRAAGDVGA